MEDVGKYIADDRYATPEHFEKIFNMTEEEFAEYLAKQKARMD